MLPQGPLQSRRPRRNDAGIGPFINGLGDYTGGGRFVLDRSKETFWTSNGSSSGIAASDAVQQDRAMSRERLVVLPHFQGHGIRPGCQRRWWRSLTKLRSCHEGPAVRDAGHGEPPIWERSTRERKNTWSLIETRHTLGPGHEIGHRPETRWHKSRTICRTCLGVEHVELLIERVRQTWGFPPSRHD